MKKMMRRMLCLTMAVMMLLSVTAGALAADVANFEELKGAFENNGGQDVSVNVTSDIDFGGNTLTAQEGITYTVGSDNGSSLANASFSGTGTVEINNMDLTGSSGLKAAGGVEVTVNDSDVTGSKYGIYVDNGTVTINNGDVTGGNGIRAHDSKVYVDGNVTGGDGDPENVDYSDPRGYSDGGYGIKAHDSRVEVTGNVTGGNGYGTYGAGGVGISADDSEVIVEGNVTGGSVTANPATQADYDFTSQGGFGIYMDGVSKITVTGNVIGGNTNADQGSGGNGLFAYEDPSALPGEGGSVSIGGIVSHGTAENGEDGYGIQIRKTEFHPLENAPVPDSITIGGCTSLLLDGFNEEEWAAYASNIKFTGASGGSAPGEAAPDKDAPVMHAEQETFWGGVLKQLKSAKSGDTVTVDAGRRTTMPATVAEAVQELGVTLVIRWDGGDDITINANFNQEPANGIYLLADL